MADPFSLAASVIGVATAAFGVSKKLHDLVQEFRESPKQFEILADQIERDATLLKCSVELIQEHEALFKEELKGLIRDINGQFANITGLVGKLLPKSRHRKRDKVHNMIYVLFQSKKLNDIMVQLEALRSTLALIVGVAQYAEQRASREVKSSTVELFRAGASHAMEDCLRNIWSLQNQGNNRLPADQRKLLAFDESPADMAVWMAVTLSAPTVPTKPLPEPRRSVAGVKIVKARRKPGLPFGPVVRAQPQYYGSRGKIGHGVTFRAGALDLKTLQTYGLPYQESVSSDGTTELIIRPEDPLKAHEVDMIVGMDLMTRIPRTKDWTIGQTPFVYLPKDIVLGRLLTEWTTMDAQRIQETTNVSPEVGVDLDLDSDSDGGASTADLFEDYEVPPVHKEKQTRSGSWSKNKPQQKHTRFSSPGGLAERFERMILPGDIPTGFAPTTPPSTMPELGSSRRHVGSGRGRHPRRVSSWALPDLTSSNTQYYGPSNQNYPSFPYGNPIQGKDFPVPPLPPSPPRGPPRRTKDDASDTVAKNTSNDHRPSTPSMKYSTTTVVNGSSGTSHEENNKGKDHEDPLERFRKRTNEGEGSQDGKTYFDTPARDTDQAEITVSLNAENLKFEATQARLMAEWEQRHKQETADLDERLEKALRILEADEKHQRYQEYLATYEQIVEDTYAELKRKEAEKQQIIEAIKEQVTAELKLEQKAATEKAKEEREIRLQQERMAEAERKQADSESRAPQTGADHFVRQFMDRPQGTTDEDAAENFMIQDAIQRFAGPYNTEFDVMSYVTEEAATAPARSVVADGIPSDDEDSDETETNGTIANELNPFYLRGSDAGQTWYHGANPVYIVEFKEGYDGEDAYTETSGSTWRGQYLLISKLWVDAEVLDKFGFKYSGCPPTYFYLNPSLTWESIETLVNFTFYMREVETFRTFGQAKHNNISGGKPPPPSLDFFAHEPKKSHSSDSKRPPDITCSELDIEHSGTEKAEEKRWRFGSRLVYPLSVLNFVLHTIS
ncbi:hypothetical protein VMCG_04051 [Cytospora schulzeri]|uniref:Azaphilone pigments biosynthesis cluster protein L N-terminal domain-containing protein n=1 Tax=Cytospora schulzeri TaxID=448051 RepID=A0A423WUE5_9PEZI|nr:hypothetical protein VMCG_04051 [Valsa malicola]